MFLHPYIYYLYVVIIYPAPCYLPERSSTPFCPVVDGVNDCTQFSFNSLDQPNRPLYLLLNPNLINNYVCNSSSFRPYEDNKS